MSLISAAINVKLGGVPPSDRKTSFRKVQSDSIITIRKRGETEGGERERMKKQSSVIIDLAQVLINFLACEVGKEQRTNLQGLRGCVLGDFPTCTTDVAGQP